MEQIVAKRYASALFDVAKKEGMVKEYYEELKKAVEILQTEAVWKIFVNKSIDKTKKMKFVEEVLEGFSKEIVNFVKVAISKHRENLIKEILNEFEALYKAYFNMIDVKVISAYPLKEEVLNLVREKLEKKYNKKVNLIPVVDKEILGGLKLVIGNTVIDGSIKARLEALLKNMRQAV
ncbi:ATP synthase F1 subunit delta [Caldanaerobacter subterraneus]|uniref:ATP synthase subunit delta n=1 Tax=Caldanaerobacter subterraneus subsp. pacificus DSM 12653 TaxID=391606 RepID=A0A0F5PNF2_9THEO|nr:ATP synthase F1 subunit delta [Caldanaerobacter subterraneus]KKC30187.1 F0F1-type ATP synthase delta subunit (mitochondrial oligomycin sensitivity protein) [Caldanaerobacter subterraneus subsp. pacificus DSM 12653]